MVWLSYTESPAVNRILDILMTAIAKILPTGIRNLLVRAYNALRDRGHRTDGVWSWNEWTPTERFLVGLLNALLVRS